MCRCASIGELSRRRYERDEETKTGQRQAWRLEETSIVRGGQTLVFLIESDNGEPLALASGSPSEGPPGSKRKGVMRLRLPLQGASKDRPRDASRLGCITGGEAFDDVFPRVIALPRASCPTARGVLHPAGASSEARTVEATFVTALVSLQAPDCSVVDHRDELDGPMCSASTRVSLSRPRWCCFFKVSWTNGATAPKHPLSAQGPQGSQRRSPTFTRRGELRSQSASLAKTPAPLLTMRV